MLDMFYNRNRVFAIFSLLWVLYIILLALINEYTSGMALFLGLALSMVQLGIGYLNYTFLVPKLLFPGRVVQYLVCLFLTSVAYISFVLILFSQQADTEPLVQEESFEVFSDLISPIFSDELILLLGIMLVFSTMLKIIESYKNKEQEALSNERQRLDTQLKFLKSQINPHFLFNSLNNIYSLVVQNSKQAEVQIMKLSALLRFLLYEADKKTIPIALELDYIRDYIEMEKIKNHDAHNKITLYEHIQTSLSIEPMLLIPFVENAFKHGNINTRADAFLKISIRCNDQSLDFEVQNTYTQSDLNRKHKHSGIGIQNVQDRLEILYPKSSQLDISSDHRVYRIKLNIRLDGEKI